MKTANELSLLKSILTDEARKNLTALGPAEDGVPHERIEEGLRAINRRFGFPLKARTLDLYSNNRVVLLGNKNRVKVPSALPAWKTVSAGVVRSMVNAVPYLPAKDATPFDNRKLFALLQYGAVLLDSHHQGPKLTASLPVAKAGSKVYSRMMHKVVDRAVGIGIDPMRSDQVRYAFAKYFLVSMLGRTANETTNAVALEATKGGTSVSALEAFEAALADAADVKSQAELYTLSIMDFLGALTASAPWLSKLGARSFVQQFVGSYGDPALMAMEDFGYFVATLGCHSVNSEIVNSFSFEAVYGKEGDDLMSEFARLVS